MFGRQDEGQDAENESIKNEHDCQGVGPPHPTHTDVVAAGLQPTDQPHLLLVPAPGVHDTGHGDQGTWGDMGSVLKFVSGRLSK